MNAWSRLTVAAIVVAATCLAVTTGSTAAPKAPGTSAGARAALAADPQLQPETHFVAVSPCRIIDTRIAGGPLGAIARTFYVGGTFGFAPSGGHAGGCGVPIGATAVAATVAVVNPSGGGYVKSWPNGVAEPSGGTILNYVRLAGAVSTGTTLGIQPTSGLSLKLKNAGAAVNVVVDISGYYIPQIQGLIGGDGSILAGTNRIVSTSHPGTGSYYVTLDRPARECSPVVTTFNLYRYASVGLSSSTTPNTISVYVWHLDSTTHQETPEDYPFFLTVTC